MLIGLAFDDRKKNFADRFKNRGKRPAPSPEPTSDIATPEDEQSPQKKPRISADTKEPEGDRSAQAEYQRAVGSYTPSLKDSGTGVSMLITLAFVVSFSLLAILSIQIRFMFPTGRLICNP
ncbi:hypothetical protein NLJ89_g3216 [Agrocybe chaxingu]|uniref:Uncharacterized protein n=1 Tax=Agrocybe chaxingu TaxID=84603 RepID=A0A9W8K5Q2_9AGAR|nr:hypothetical protein NLJ89_g3216 [Agrocybe chaxingu]